MKCLSIQYTQKETTKLMGSCHSHKINQYEVIHFLTITKSHCRRNKTRQCKVLSDLDFDILQSIFRSKNPTSQISSKDSYIYIIYSEEDLKK